jgi:CheY-like chemotaxis protein
MSHLLTELGFEVQTASDGVEALAEFEKWRPHAVLMDMQMPVMDGFEAIRRIKATPEGRATVVIAITASAFEEEKTAILACGADDFVRKPFRETELVALLGRRLNLSFEEEGAPAPEAPLVPTAAADFAKIPAPLRASFLKAAEGAYYHELLELCDQLSAAGNGIAADALRSRVTAFDYMGVGALLSPKEMLLT